MIKRIYLISIYQFDTSKQLSKKTGAIALDRYSWDFRNSKSFQYLDFYGDDQWRDISQTKQE